MNMFIKQISSSLSEVNLTSYAPRFRKILSGL
jgi:hypothetical protein